MSEQQFLPSYLTVDEFLAVLDDIRARVAVGDSLEGSLSWEFPWSAGMGYPVTDPVGPGFRVRASYRIGNTQGQGGYRMLGEQGGI
ncbi:MAG: hypothetical protein WAV90_11075 [Gordonia amarae]